MPRTDRPAWVKAEYDRIGRERDAASREANRLSLWEFVRVCALMFLWMIAGCAVAAVGFHVHDRDTGMIYIYSGMIVNLAGVLWTIARAYRRGEERGDW